MNKPDVSEMDKSFLSAIRENVERTLKMSAIELGFEGARVLDVAPQDHDGAAKFFEPIGAVVHTLDINPESGATYVADLCNPATLPSTEGFDIVVCTEVLEHTRQPFVAADSLYALLKPGGRVVVTTPFNFRIHGPLPDCWRFTEHGLRELFRAFEQVEITPLECPDRFLMPIQYVLLASRPLA